MRKLAQIQNDRINKKLNKNGIKSRSTINSGAIAIDPGDTELKDYLLEEKTLATEQMTMSIDRRWFTKVRDEAFKKGKKDGLLSFDFGCQFDCIAMTMETWINIISSNATLESKIKSMSSIVDECIASGEDWEEGMKKLFRILQNK
jgi:hypothetical protein